MIFVEARPSDPVTTRSLVSEPEPPTTAKSTGTPPEGAPSLLRVSTVSGRPGLLAASDALAVALHNENLGRSHIRRDTNVVAAAPTWALIKMRAAVLPSFTRVEICPAGLVVEKLPSNSADPGGCTSQNHRLSAQCRAADVGYDR